MQRLRFAPFSCAVVLLLSAACGPTPDSSSRSDKPLSSPTVTPSTRTTVSTPKPYHTDYYIPKDLDECFVELKKLLSEADQVEFRDKAEDDVTDYHHGLGRWLRNNWGLWAGERLAIWFNERGITHPDDMSGIILDSFWRHLNDKPIQLEEQIKFYQDYWTNVKQENRH